ncbi:SnoK protein [Capsulimonas corticalis]|uniref:SnoK protein n=1 Tax=Capsulimonas corticalis TaxID=2219043 RepID=A0A402CSQ5_9BACT|nr:phytanoyl-CoA dioxygenase family protein [Capsulimonas corticalis]BDI31002.1 SnoK protein [Capsulimonas corticalis]
MNTQLTADQIAFYQENGYIVLENFLTPDELERWRWATDESVAQRLEAVNPGLTNQSNPDAYFAQVFTQCLKLADTHAGMREIMFDPELGKVAATLAGVEGIRIWHDQALIKPPYGNPTAWHLDNPYWSFSSRDSISIWVALDDATLSNGCLYYAPGTQKTARDETVDIGKQLGGLFSVYPEWRAIDPVAGPCPAGSAVFHNGLTAHGAGANMTNKPRRAMTCAYMPDGSTFNGTKNILPKDYFESLTIGDALNDNTMNPLIWSRKSS